jgi:hypothetical protein
MQASKTGKKSLLKQLICAICETREMNTNEVADTTSPTIATAGLHDSMPAAGAGGAGGAGGATGAAGAANPPCDLPVNIAVARILSFLVVGIPRTAPDVNTGA